jgi:hypothetical protein
MGMSEAEALAVQFHTLYERKAPSHGYNTRERSRVPWGEVPDDNKMLMIDVCATLLAEGVIEYKG